MATRKTPASAKPSPTPATKKASARKAAPAQPARKPAAGKPVTQPMPKPATPAQAASPKKAAPAKDKTDKARKPKMVRDSFTMPKAEYAAIDALKARATQAGRPAKKSELLRAGVKLLESLEAAALVAALQALPAIKTGRPAQG